MAPGGIRLRLIIRRHTVPDIKLVWPCVPSDDLTIAKLLSQINEVIPLEGGEWGLEDYAVELGDANGPSFECLHFQLVIRILKDEDQILIRPLLSDDLKRRRLSGRHQISNGGKHLVDGIAFGRAWNHAPGDRPALELPPRKRARIAYDTDDGDDESEDDADWDEENDNDDVDERLSASSPGDATGESSHNEDDSEELLHELKLLKQDRKDISEHSSENSDNDDGDIGYGLLPTVDSMAALRLAFPLVPVPRIEKELRRQGYDVREGYDELASTFQASLSFDQMMDSAITGTAKMPGTPHFSEMESLPPTTPTRPLIQEIESSNAADDDGSDSQDETSSSGSSDDSGASDMNPTGLGIAGGNKLQTAGTRLIRSVSAEISDDSASDSEFDSDSRSDSNSSSDSAGSSVVRGVSISKAHDTPSDSSDSSSDSTSSDESDSPPEETRSKPSTSLVKVAEQPHLLSESVPGAGLTKTQKRNARRKKAKQARLELEQNGQMSTPATPNSSVADQYFLARKAALLEALGSDTPQTDPVPALAENTVPAGNMAAQPTRQLADESGSGTAQAQTNGTDSDSPRRMRVNLGAGRRLLFGALGLKAPKSKADEDQLREKLMKDVRPHKNTRLIEEVQEAAPDREVEMDDDSWRQKINYRAVECCYDGIVLSEPPFPFVQRWDPQQQYNEMRKRKRQSEQSYYEDYEDYEEHVVYDEVEQHTSRKKAKGKNRQSVELGTDLPAASNGVLDKDAAARSSPTTDAEDLPSLPTDITALPALANQDAKPGMVITWKQLTMSKATNWQPLVMPATGLVISGDGAGVHVVLAKRDREDSDKLYDKHTGKRIYERFEAPESEDEDEDEDDGHRTLAWNEMMEPRIVQGEPPAGFMEAINGHAAGGVGSQVSQPDRGNGDSEPDTQTLRAEVQNEVANMPAGGGDSASIDSARRPHQFDLPMLADDGLISVASDSWETSKAAQADEGRPSRLKETAVANRISSASGQGQETAADKVAVVKPLFSKTTGTAARPASTAKKGNTDGVIPASFNGSLVSGANGEAADSLAVLDDGLIPETLPTGMDATEAEQDWIANGAPSGSSSPFPSLEEIFQTASTSRETAQSAPTTRAEVSKHVDEEYEEAMRQLDNGELSDGSAADDAQKLFPNATQPTRPMLAVELPMAPREPRSSPRSKRKATKGDNKFVMPAGSQAITLSSSPPPRQDHALDDEDETYTPGRKRRRNQAGGSQTSKTMGGPASQTRRRSSLRQSESESVDGEGSQRAKLRRRSSGTQ